MESPIDRIHRAFTLIETLVVLGLIGALMTLSLLLSMDVYRSTAFRSTRAVLVSTLTTARSRSLANLNQSPHGVCSLPPDLILFEGEMYDPASPMNERIPGNPAVQLTSVNDFFDCTKGVGIIFSQLEATTSENDMIVLTERGHKNTDVRVNEEGTILW